ncbi:MFS transporter [Methylobacterium oryzae CBMB20]
MSGMHGVNGWSGWQWVFLLEGIPSILAGLVTLLYLTDRPAKAGWLTPEQKALVEADLARDTAALGHREHRVLASLKDARVWQCIAIFFCIVTANSALTFFGPSVVRDAGFTDPLTVGWIMSAAYLCGGAGMILNGRHSDRTGEARLHCGVPAFVGALAIALTGVFIAGAPILALIMLGVAIVGTMSAIPVFWQIPGRFLAGSAAAAGIALINSVANLAGFGAPAVMGYLRGADRLGRDRPLAGRRRRGRGARPDPGLRPAGDAGDGSARPGPRGTRAGVNRSTRGRLSWNTDPIDTL